MPPIVIIGRFRYINARVMSAGHDWAEENSDLRGLKGLIKVDTFHIAPDRGMVIFYLRTAEHAKASLPQLENSFDGYSKMFDCKILLYLVKKINWDLEKLRLNEEDRLYYENQGIGR